MEASYTLDLIVLGFNDTSTLVGHFVLSPREREKRDRRGSRGDKKEDSIKNRGVIITHDLRWNKR